MNKMNLEKNRAQRLKKVLAKKYITILGHDNIDVDAALSGILMSRLLNFMGIENEFCILEKVKKDDTFEILQEMFGIDMSEFEHVSEDYERTILLLDHYETVHCGEVIACIDHHPNSAKNEYQFMYTRNSCATAYLIYEIMQEAGFPVGAEEAKMIVVSMMVDTTAFRSSKTIKEEAEEAKVLAEKFGLDYEALEKYCLCLTPINKLTAEQIISNGQKWYDYSGYTVGSSYLQLYGLPDERILNDWLERLEAKRYETDCKMLVFIIFETKENLTYEYRITEYGISKLVKQGILSRGKDIMPVIENMFLPN